MQRVTAGGIRTALIGPVKLGIVLAALLAARQANTKQLLQAA